MICRASEGACRWCRINIVFRFSRSCPDRENGDELGLSSLIGPQLRGWHSCCGTADIKGPQYFEFWNSKLSNVQFDWAALIATEICTLFHVLRIRSPAMRTFCKCERHRYPFVLLGCALSAISVSQALFHFRTQAHLVAGSIIDHFDNSGCYICRWYRYHYCGVSLVSSKMLPDTGVVH